MKFNDFITTILLEKDNRQKIVKLGIPQEVADYLHNMSNKYSLWFADKINKMPAYQASKDKLRFVATIQTDIQRIIDWIRGEQNVLLNNYDWQTAVQKSIDYHDNLKITNNDRETNTILKEYPDGFYWVDIESTSDSCERASMGHCASTSKGDTLYSLRKYNKASDSIESFITIAISPDEGVWYQCKGRRNSKPKEEYFPYIVDILISKNVFQFKTEYDSRNDFKDSDFKRYLEENPNAYPNTDEIIEKINSSSISIIDFEKILEQYQSDFKHYDITVNDSYDDESDSVYASYSFYLNIESKDTDLPVDCLSFENRQAKTYFSNYVTDVYVTDINVDNYQDGTRIYCNFEDSDDNFSMDEYGLKSFEKQCEYYKGLNEKFDYEEFLKNHLEKILILDDCLETELTSFTQQVQEDFEDFYKIKTQEKTLDVEIKLSDSEVFGTNININDFLNNSVLKSVYTDEFLIQSPEKFKKDLFFKEKKHADALLMSMFWSFIKNNVLQEYSRNMRIYYQTRSKTFDIKFEYDFDDEQTNYTQELKYLKILQNKHSSIKKSLDKFINDVFIPVVQNKIPFDISDFVFKKSYSDIMSQIYTNDDSYIGTYKKDLINDEFLKNLIKQENLSNGYKNFDERKVFNWLDNNIENSQLLLPKFKDFFESRMLTSK